MLLIKYEDTFTEQELFGIFYPNMKNIMTIEGTDEENYIKFADSMQILRKEKNRYFLIARDNNIAVAFFMFIIEDDSFKMEEMQIKKEYQGRYYILKDFLFFAKTKIPRKVQFVRANVNYDNIKAQKILEHLGLIKDGFTPSGITYKGEIKILKKF